MSLKKNIGVLVLLLVLLSMSAVSAEDVSINTNDTYQAPNEIQKDFTSLQTDIDNSQNVFELNYDVKHGDDEKDNYGISITKTTIINGNGHTIDANGHGSIFVVKDSSVTLTLNDLTLINANPVSDSSGIVSNGGAVYFDGSTLIVNNVNFKNNTVYKYGGAIYTTGTCIVDSSVFDGNDVQFRSQNTDNGGAAIYADNGASLLISNSQIINNHKNMVIRDNNVGDLVDGVVVATGYTKISKSYFRNNSGCYGGAVTSLGYTNAGKNQIIIENSVFDANRAFQGAAVNVMGSTFKISGTNFTNNKGVGYGSGNPNVGALLTWYGCEGTISDCNFINNTADNGAAYRLGDDNKGVSSASVDSCTFINNTASNQGGAVYEGGTTGNAILDIKNSIFTNNSAKEGSAIYNEYTLTIDADSTFTNNRIYSYYRGTLNMGEIKTFTDLQKAVNMVEGYINLNANVDMLASEADKFVNGIVVDHLVNMKGNDFTINANNLGRIFDVTSTGKLNIYSANLINGRADMGGAIYNTGKTYALDTTFKDNTATTMGGAVFNNGTLTIEKCIVDNNDITKRTSSDSEDYGGAAIYNWYDSTLFIKNSTISNNLKNYKNGDYVVGAVTSLGKTIISQNSYFVNNSGRWGGAITTSGSSLPGKKVNELSISDSTFSKNGGLYGAGIFIQGSKFSITSCVFDSNTASGKGNMTPNDNNGAAIEVTNTDKAITGTIYKSTFTNNKAQYGGAIDICAGTIKITNSKFINNSADVEGGAIDINAANGNPKVTISSSNFINNSAPVGGAICNVHDLTVKGSTFIDNTPNTIFNWVGAGGNLNLNIKTFTDLQNAIGLVTGTLTLNQNVALTTKEAADFTNGITINKDITIDGKGHTIDAKNLGRIFSIGEGFTVTLTNATLINGKATEGGAIYNDGSLTLSDVKLSDNAADSYGGAVFNNGELVVSDSVFDSNDIVNRGSASVDYGGAAIYNWYGGTLTVSGSNFTNNIKNYKNGDNLVGAIATIGNATVSGSNFVNNSGRWGGAISTAGYLLAGDDVNTLTVSGSTFKENGGLYGAGIFVAGSDFTVSDCVFDKNSAFGKGNMTPNNNNGAAIVVTDTGKDITGIITDSNFTNNKAHFSGAVDICEGKITIKNSIFVNNSAEYCAGAIAVDSQINKPAVEIINSKFDSNSAEYGGAIYNYYNLTVVDSTFTNNSKDTIYNFRIANLDLGIKTFTDLQNAIGLVRGTLTLDSDIAMTDDEAANFKDGVAINKNIRIDGKGHTISAEDLGRIFSIGEGFTVTLTNATLINGKADKGGAIYNDGSLTLSDVKLSDNAADSYGGAVFNNGHLVVGNSVFDANDIVNRGSASVDYGGAAIYNWYDGVLTVSGSNFTNNIKNYKNGDRLVGAIATIGDATISDSYFVNNAGRWGGAISTAGYLLAGDDVNTLTVSGSTFKENGGLYGAGIFVAGSDFTVSDCVFDKNTAFGKGDMTPNNNNGAAIVVTDTGKDITGAITGSKFTNNKAQYGGAIYICEGNIAISDSLFENNSADVEGGAIDIGSAINNPVVTIEDSKFVNNAPQAIHNSKELHLGIETFTDLQNAINLVDGILTLDSDIAMTDDEAAGFVDGVAINKNIRIDGKGHTISAEDLGRIFSIGEGFTVTLTNATLINGKADKGGAIYNDGSLTLSDVKLSDNTADKYGGAVFNNGNLVVGNSVFDSNDIVNRGSASVDYGGAAIYNWYDGVLTVSGSNFTNNIKNYKNGDRLVGAIATIGDATISDSYFVNNAGRWGGAITTSGALIAGDDVNTLTVSGSTFKENGGLYGAGIFVWGSDFIVSDCVFDKNTASGKGDMTPNNNNGAAIEVTDTNKAIAGTITGSKFTNNKAQYGGAIDICEGNIKITDSEFVNNSADVEGGAIDISTVNGNPEVLISDSKFINNSASYGGAIVNVKDLTVRNTEFVNNNPDAIFNYVGFGGNLDLGIENFTDLQNAIGLVTGTLTLNQNVVMTDDEAANFVNGVVINKNIRIDGKGHTIDARDLGRIFSIGEGFTVTLTNATLINGKADKGGAIYNDGSLTLSDVKLSDNAADSYGGAVFNNGHLVVSDSVFDSNDIVNRGSASVDHGGAAIYNWKEGTLKVTNSNFTNNIKNYKNGDNLVGAITTIGNATVSGSNFVNNSGRWGGAISATGAELRKNSSTLTVSNTIFRDNAALYAGAVYIWGSNYNIADCVFDNNTAFGKGNMTPNNNNGGALVVSQVSKFNEPITGTISGSKFTNNKAQYGGAAYFNKGFVTITDSVFENNIATAEGGAVGFSRASVKDLVVSINNSSFVGNKAPVAGAIFTNVDSKITNSNFTKNTASKGGAVLNENGAKLTVDNSTFKDNAADSYGGAVLNNGELIVTNSVFDANDILNRGSAGVDHGGAAIYNWENAKLDISKSNFTNNIKNYVNGDRLVGAVTTIGNATIRDSYFVNNSGRWGGALAATGGVSGSAINTISVDGTKFVNNTALYGGAMFVWASNYTISNSVFDNNSAFGKGDMSPNDNNGGALIVTQDNIPVSGKIVNSNFTNNKAQYGGAAWINEGTVDIDGSNFINNTATTAAGAIGFDSQYTKIIATVDSSKFVNNTAGSYAGAIYNLGDLTVSGSEFDNNKAQFGDIIYNNKIYNKEGILSINGNKYSNYTENKAPIINIGDINTISSTGGIIVTVLDNKTVNVCYGDVVTLHATVVADGVLVAGQKLFFVIDNVEYIANSLGNGSYIASYEVKDVGSKTVGIVYDGSDVNIKTGMLNISKATPDLTVGALNITVGDLEIITVTGPKDATGLITLTLNGIDYILPIYNGEAKFYFQDLTADEYEVSASYSGDNHYVAAENSTVFKVDKVLANLKINVEDITFGENGLVIITLPSDIDGSVVTVNVNGKVYPVTVENGFAKLPLRELNAGDYTISAVFAGNDKYLPGVSNALLTVSKADPALNVFISDVDYDGAFNINVALTGVDAIGLNGDVIVTVNGKDYTVNVANGKGNIPGVKLAAGTYDFTAKFAGSDNYNDVSDSGNFKVNKVDSAIDVAVKDINVGEDAVISVKLLSDATGSVTVTVNGEDYTEPVVNGVVNVKVSGLKADTYDVAVKYSGDNNYNDAVATSSFTVSKVDPTMDVTADDIVFGEDLTVNAVLPADATGEVVITVDGVDYPVAIVDGKATGTIGGLAAGDYTVSVKYAGDDKYAGVEVTEVVNVAKADAVLGVVIADVDYGNGFVIEVTLTGVNNAPLSGNVIVTVNGKEYTVVVNDDGKGIATGDKLAARTYGFAAVWAGNDNYNIVTENGDFKVNKVDSAIDVAVSDIKVGEDAVISVKLADDATGEVVITVNGEDYTAAIENGVATVTVSDLKAGDYTVAVKYAGDNNYNGATGSAEFSVSKITPDMDVTVNNIVFGEDLTVNAVLPADATGEVVITVNGEDYTAAIENGVASVTVSDLKAGDYTVAVKYAGDNNYNAVDVTKGVNVAKADAALNVIINNVDYGNVFTVNAVLTGVNNAPLTGDVIVTVNGKDYTVNVVNGKGNVTGVKLAAGSYDFTAKFAGDNNYNAVSDSGKFNVNKVDSAIYVAVSDIKVGEDAVITVKLLSDATGNVTVNVNGKNYNGTVINGMANVEVSGLKADTYDVAVKYSGDNNYNDAVATSSFTVSKVDPTMDVTVDGIVFGEDLTVEAVLPADATGKVVIVVDGTSYTANITDGKATQVVKDLTAGYHTVGVKYGGDDKYNDVVVDGFVIVDKAQPVLGVVIADVNYGNEFAIEATLTGVNSTPLNGNVIVTVNGKFYVVNVTDGKGTLTGVKLAAGTYGFTAVWAGNDNYAAVDENGDFKVNKLNSTVAVNADDIKVGENVTVSVNVPSDATGNVIVTVDGKDYTVAIVDGKAVKTISDLKANNYTVTVKYDGDNNYNANQNTTKFTVSKISDYNMNITVPGDVKVGEDAVIIVNVPKDASGNVTVSVGKDVYNAVISNGSAKVVVSGLGAGVYNVSANFTDDKYAQNKANATVVVSKVTDYNMNITVPEFKEGVNSTISVDLPKDATGTVTVEIDGKKYTANVTNGTAKVNIPALSAGNHNITTTYSGDAKYDSMTKKGNITVIPNVNLDVNDVVMFYHDGTRLVAKLTDSQGKPIVNATIYFNINGVDYAKSTDDNGTASMGLNLDSNVYAVTVTYNGSDIYSKISKNVTVTINPSIIAKDLVKMYQNDTKFYAKFIGSDGKALVNTTVRFNIHGVFYNRTTNDDGIAELGIMLRPGNYILTAYNPVTGEEQGFNITVKSLIVQNDLTKYYLNASKFEATIYDKNGSLAVNKTVTFNIHGVFYTRSTDDKGVVSLGISLRPGEYIITTIYEGLAVGNNITVLPTLVTRDLNMTHEDGSNFTAQTLDGQGKPLANQNVTFNINGVFYNKVTDENGVASLAMRLMSGKYIITSYWNDFQTGNTIIIS
ncbi:Ig-like domain repeat protein [Methanobrevibacter smithii]|uniref:Ig-like domain repeat protein n=2 Tax=Methanobrevibacter smithii TaxID=2173 RepID=UPI0037DD1ECF